MVCLIFPPEQAEVAEHDDEIIACQLLLLRKGFVAKFVDVDGNVGIACQVNHDACPQSNISVIQTVSKQNSFLFSTCSSRCLVVI